jgi:hypothetical protein
MPAMLLGRIVRDRNSDRNFLDRDFVHDTLRRIRGCAHDVRVLGFGQDGRGSDSRRRGGSRGRSLDIEFGDSTWALGLGGCVGLGRDRCDRGQRGGGSGLVGRAGLERVGVAGAVLHGDVAAEAFSGARAVVGFEDGWHGLDVALALLGFGLERGSEDGAVFDAAGGVGALGYSGLENVNVPAVHEVAVVAVACTLLVTLSEWMREKKTHQWGHRWTR